MGQVNVTPQTGNSGIAMLHDYWSMALRRKWILLGVIVVSLAAALVYCKLATKVYRSDMLILIEDQKILETYVQGTAEGNINFERRIFVFENQVRDRTRLEKIQKGLNLYPDEVEAFGQEWAVATMNQALEVKPFSKKGSQSSENNFGAFTISFAHEDPATAMNVTSRIGTILIDEDLKARAIAAEGTTEFLDSEANRTKAELDKKEAEISQFKSYRAGQLPQQLESNLLAIDRLQNELNAVRESLQRHTNRLALVEHALQQYLQFGLTIPSLVNGLVQPNLSFARLNELKNKLAQLEAEFWDGYPEVALTKEEIKQLEETLRRQYGSHSGKSDEQTNDPYYHDLKKQLMELKNEQALLTKRQGMLQAEKVKYETFVKAAPVAEQELLTLTRDYENLKASYQSLRDKRLHALVAENLEKRQKGAQLRILEQANLPRVPERPNQPRVIILGLLFGCALGTGVLVLLEQLNPQFRRPEDVEVLFGVQLLALIPDFSFEYNRVSWYNRIGWKRPYPGSETFEASGQGVDGSEVRTIVSRGVRDQEHHVQPFKDSFIAKWLPHSTIAEQYRVAVTRLSLVKTDGHSTVVVVTSAVKGEGKTTTAINMGYTMARDLGKRTLILDCDFKSPMLHHYAETIPRYGLAECLIDDIQLGDCLAGFKDAPCWIMPVGSCDIHSTELLKSERLAGILEKLREQFEYIFINTPPIFPLAVMNILVKHADILLFVVRANSTPKHVVQRALSSLPFSVPAQVVLNGVGNQALPSYISTYEYLGKPS